MGSRETEGNTLGRRATEATREPLPPGWAPGGKGVGGSGWGTGDSSLPGHPHTSTLSPEDQGRHGDPENEGLPAWGPSSLPLCTPAHGQDPEAPAGTAQRLGGSSQPGHGPRGPLACQGHGRHLGRVGSSEDSLGTATPEGGSD